MIFFVVSYQTQKCTASASTRYTETTETAKYPVFTTGVSYKGVYDVPSIKKFSRVLSYYSSRCCAILIGFPVVLRTRGRTVTNRGRYFWNSAENFIYITFRQEKSDIDLGPTKSLGGKKDFS